MNHAGLRLQAGGTLNPRQHVYIERPEDARVLELLLRGEYVNVLSARQMGKSSLMVRTMGALRARGVRTATVDLASEVGAPAEPAAFFQTLLARIAEALDLDIDVEAWWRERPNETVNQHVLAFFRDEVLGRVAAPVVVFLDEIDFDAAAALHRRSLHHHPRHVQPARHGRGVPASDLLPAGRGDAE